MYASHNGHLEIVKLLLAVPGIDINLSTMTEKSKETLQMAINSFNDLQRKNIQIISELFLFYDFENQISSFLYHKSSIKND